MNLLNKILTLFIPLFVLFYMQANAQRVKMYVGTYTDQSTSKGVYIYDLNTKSGDVTLVNTIEMSNPSFLARKGNILYAVNEDAEGMLTVYDLKANQVLSHVSTGGAHPCHIALSPGLPIAIVSNYSSGSFALFSLNEDGSIKAMEESQKFEDVGLDKARQSQSHIHSAFFTRDGKGVFISNLGGDKIYEYEILENKDRYSLKLKNEIQVKPGGGPRHLVLSNNQNTIYSMLELTGEVQVLQRENEKWVSKQIIAMYPDGFQGEHGGADIKMSKDGKFIYATNRGTANFVYAYHIQHNGLLTLKGSNSVFGDSPRNINISPDGKFIMVSNQLTNNISLFTMSNLFQEPKASIDIPKPVCVIF